MVIENTVHFGTQLESFFSEFRKLSSLISSIKIMRFNRYFIIIILTGLVVLFITYPFLYRIKRVIQGTIEYYSSVNRSNNGVCPNCEVIFVDNVKKQEEAYKKEGIKPQKNIRGLKKLLRSGKLKTVKTNEFYIINDLDHSSTYLMPKAVVFIRDLFKIYNNKCNKKTIPFVPFTISSITRTKTDVLKLMHVNKNAIPNSSHLKGKTFDVNYLAFKQNKNQTKCFIAALSELRKKNRCFVKFERNGCLHITVI